MNKFKNLWTGLFFLLSASIGTIQAQVTADFVADDLVVCPGVPVIFTNLSTYPAGSSPTYLWSFPSGFASSLTEANPTVYYYTPGTYSVTLTTSVAGTGSDVETKTAYITVVTPPDANFTYTIPDLCNQMVVNFTNTSVAGSAPITSKLWDFDDATFSALSNPIKTFTSENTFNVILFVTDANGCSDNVTVPVTTLAPVESAISSTGSIFSCGLAIAPTILAITSEGTAPYTYSWDYGNGTSSILPSSLVNYSDCGTYDITYTVTDANGCSLTNSYDDYIEISCPEVDFSMSDDTVCLASTASFINLSDPGAVSYYWQFNYPTALATSTEENPVAEFVAAGMRIIRLTVTYPGGCTAYHQDTIQVVPRPAITGIAASDSTGCEIPFVTTLTPLGLTGTGPYTFLWESGGMTSTDSAATFTYNDYINYTVSLTITDANGCSVFYTFIGFIKIKKPTNAFSATPIEGCAPLKVTFTNTSSSTYVPLSYYVWNYGDGTIDTTYSLGSHNHWFMVAGTYNVTMTLYTVDGCPKTSNLYITLGNEVAYFEIINDDDPTCNPVEIDNLSFGADETTIDWGDGTTSFFIPGTLDTSHVYPAADTATYIITLIAEDRGCISTWVDTITILPVITIVTTTWNCDNPLEFYYVVDTSVVTGDFCWDFGSGDVFCNQVAVSYTYPGPGTYSGEITTLDPIEYEGCELVQTFSSLVPDNDFSFDINTVGGCGSFEYSIASNVAPDFPSELTYTWNIGPSSISGFTDVITDTSFFNYTFPEEDAYPIEMTINDVNGCVYSSMDTIIISGAVALFNIDSIVGCSPFTVYVSDASTLIDDAGGDISIESYEWNFSGGTCPTYFGISPPPCTFATGTHSVTLTITDNGGCEFSYTEEIDVVSDVIASFIADELACNSTEPLYFSNTSTGDITDVTWDFGDGFTSTDFSALHPYAIAGAYTVSLTVSDAFGCSDVQVQNINVVLDSIYAGFDVTYLTASACPPIPIQLANTSTGDYIDFWWDVERETGIYTYTLDTIILTYTLPGDYDVSIYVTGATGCIDTLTIENALYIPGPTGTMEYTPMMDCTPAEITFDFSDLTADLTYVDFGDGDTILVTGDATYNYAEEGVYCPTLILIDASGCSFQIACDSSITIYQTHDIDITVSDTGLCLGEILTIYNASIGSPLNPIEGYLVDYGDGTPVIPLASFDSLTYTYSTSGTYVLNVFTMSDVACSDTIQYEINVFSEPEAGADISPISGCYPLDVNFTITDLIADVAILDYGDGIIDTIAGDISHTYTTFGIFHPTLTLINGSACAVEIEFADAVHVYFPPTAGLIIPDTIACSGEQLIFINNSSDTSFSLITNYTLDFGDGSTPYYSDVMDTVYHAFTTDGSYVSTFIVENSAGCTDTLIFNTYADQLPVGALNISPLEGCVPLEVNFDVVDLIADEAIIDFGDGNSDTITASIVYTYLNPGDFTPIFYLNNANGCTTVLTYETIDVELIPTAGFIISDTTICISTPVSIINTSFDTIVSPITSYAIKYGDGTVDVIADFDTLEYFYASPGIYNITVIAQNSAGCRDTIIHAVEVFDIPLATFSLLPITGCIPFDVDFDLDIVTADEMLLYYGDGLMDTITGDTSHIYSTAGSFEPYLLISNNAGCFDSIAFDVVEAGITPIADFTITDSTICFGEPIEITNNAWDTTLSPIISYTIDFGDGTISTSATFTSLTHNYSSTGGFVITLSVENNLGCDDLISKNVSVGEMPFATLALDPLEGCLPLDITFDFDAIAADEIIIAFGDGNIDTVSGDVIYTYVDAGTFAPTVSLLNANGCAFDVIVSDDINVGITPIADFTITDSTI
ncbi:MAG: PKD domain-containing protein, partial [Chitinophagales bacterium]|nr:PKD domain-containing protein [Chitinophagales bacterium]